MKFFRLHTHYPAYIQQFYESRPDLHEKPFEEQYRTIVSDSYGWADFWEQTLRPRGHEVWEPPSNVEPLQKKWAQENDVSCSQGKWQYEITLAQIRKYQPDVLFTNDHTSFDAAFIRAVRSVAPSIRLVVGWCGSPPHTDVFGEYDILLSNIPALVEYFRNRGINAYRQDHAFFPGVLDRIASLKSNPAEFTFLGSIVCRPGYHSDRAATLRKLTKSSALELFSVVAPPAKSSGILEYLSSEGRQRLRFARWAQELQSRAKPPLFGNAMFRKLADSRLTFNNHIDIAGSSANNMRLFEATGTGACLLTDWKPDLRRLFEPDSEALVYRSAGEAKEKMKYILEHEPERRKIAEAGQKRTLRDHTFSVRADVLLELIQENTP